MYEAAMTPPPGHDIPQDLAERGLVIMRHAHELEPERRFDRSIAEIVGEQR